MIPTHNLNKEIPRCCDLHKQIDLNNERLSENNRTLQAKLREGKREAYKECIAILDNKYSAFSKEHNEGLNMARAHIMSILSFQQEPQDI